MPEIEYNEGASVKGTLELEHRRNGELLSKRIMPNLEMDLYKALRAGLRIGDGTPPAYIAIGTGTTEEAVDDEAMEAEKEVDRQLATTSQITITIENDTSQYTFTFTLEEDTDVSEAGLLNELSGGTLCYHRVFTAIPCLKDDTLKVTWRSKS